MKFLQDKLNSVGKITYANHFHDSADNSDSVKQISQEGSNFVADPLTCRISFHWETVIDGKTSLEGSWIDLKAVQAARVLTKAESIDRAVADSGHPNRTVETILALWALDVHKPMRRINTFIFLDEDTASRVAKAMVSAVILCGGEQVEAVLTRSTPTPETTAKVDNTVPFGEGAPVTSVQIGDSAGGLKFGEGGSGTFGNLFGWYTNIVANKVHQAWQSEVNPSISSAKRVYILFDISRSGAPSDIRIKQSSGIPSLDQAAVRALQLIDTFGPLPQGYSGSYVPVEFWFDYRR